MAPSPSEKAGDEVLPEFNEEFVKGLGPFENIEDFKNKLKINIKLEKENQAKEKTRLKTLTELISILRLTLLIRIQSFQK